MTIAVAHLFPTPLVIDALPGAQEVNSVLAPAIRKAAADRPWSGPLPAASEHVGDVVVKHLLALVDRYTEDDLSPHASRYRWAADVVAQYAPSSVTAEAPRRYDAFWTAIYFIDDGYGGSASRDMAGEMVIEDPRLPMPMAEMPQVRLRTVLDPSAPAYEPEILVRPGAGRLLLFPGWLRVRRRLLESGRSSCWLTVNLIPYRR